MNTSGGSAPSPASVGVIGATGYTGRELLGLLHACAGVEVVFASSRSRAGQPSVVPEIPLVSPDEAPAGDVDVLFLCLPHGKAVPWVERFAGRPRIVDLTADHRPGSGRDGAAIYGLAERNGSEVAGAELVANPGCYPTGALLALGPLADAELIDAERVTVVNAASGVTGAGRRPREDLLFAEVWGNYKAYGAGNRHRHLREIRSTLPELSLLFQPHLLPLPRGILETIVVPVRAGADAGTVRDAWRTAYAGAGAIRVLEERLPELSDVVGTDRLALGVTEVDDVSPPVVTVVAALDNLGKGAAGQAIQNMNLMLGRPMDRGIRC